MHDRMRRTVGSAPFTSSREHEPLDQSINDLYMIELLVNISEATNDDFLIRLTVRFV